MSSERTTATISIGKGVQYAKVSARLSEFHRDNAECSINTACRFEDGHVVFSATATTSKGTFTGHSYGRIDGQNKGFEKLETISVGRALAFSGYLADGAIATSEEMDSVVTESQLNGLKMKFATINAIKLDGLARPDKLAAFCTFCRSIVGEDVDYSSCHSWCREWYDSCWKSLIDNSDVPFEE